MLEFLECLAVALIILNFGGLIVVAVASTRTELRYRRIIRRYKEMTGVG